MKKMLIITLTIVVFLIILTKNFNKVENSIVKVDVFGATLGTSETLSFQNSGIGNIIDIKGGHHHNLILNSEGIVYSFGSNGNESLGGGSKIGASSNIPVRVLDNPSEGFINGDPNNKVIKISAGAHHNLILTSNGTVYSFGWNSNGQLGNGDDTFKNSNIPVKVVDNPSSGFINGNPNNKVVDISAGAYHNLILTENKHLYAFGRNDDGGLGNGIIESKSYNKPILVSDSEDRSFVNGTSDIIQVVARYGNSIFLTSKGETYTFGRNDFGQLGIGSNFVMYKPILIVDNPSEGFVNGDPNNKVIQVSSGMLHNIILTESGHVYGFGRNVYGELGLGNLSSNVNKATLMKNANGFINGNVRQVGALGFHSLLITNDNTLYSVGRNDNGQLGIGKSFINGDYNFDKNGSSAIDQNDAYENLVVKVIDGNSGFENSNSNEAITHIVGGDYQTFILTEKNNLFSVGRNSTGQLGNGEDIEQTTFVPIERLVMNFDLTGKAIIHSSDNNVMKYSTNTTIGNIKLDAHRETVELKKASGEYQDITIEYTSATNGGENKYIVGESGTPFEVGLNTEESFTIRVKDINSSIVMEYTFIVDKKPPTLSEIIESGNTSVCNVINNNEYYCNSSVSFIESTDLSEFYLVKKEVLGVETDITLDIRNGLINELATANTEKSKITYTLIDGAGNQTIVKLIMDNYKPRAEIK